MISLTKNGLVRRNSYLSVWRLTRRSGQMFEPCLPAGKAFFKSSFDVMMSL
jgi:hypothetical protein